MESARPDLRPLGVGEMVDGAIRLYRNNFLTLIKISAMVLGPIAVVELIATAAVGPLDLATMLVVDPDATAMEVFEPLIPIYSVLALTGILSFLGSVLVQGASITALAQAMQGEEPDWRVSLRAGARRFFPLMLSTILLSLGSGIGLIFCLVPGIFLFTMWTVSPAALVTERLGPVAALGRSYRLVKGRFWPVLGAVVLAYLLYVVVSQIVGAVTSVLTIVGAVNGEQISFLPAIVGSSIVSVISAPFLAAMVTIIYFDLRVRKEGYDLELMARDLERMESASPTHTTSDDDPFGLGAPDGR
ncbi:MAG TPA: hypothetical protein VHL52_14295 [Acidimicrobiia bacterium]|nr:hypothetical protein [Acidimicrobiia bacterium]